MGCGSHKIYEQVSNIQGVSVLPNKFIGQVQNSLNKIDKQKHEQNEDLNNSLSYLLNNERYFWIISNNKQLCQQLHGLILQGTIQLFDCLPDYIKSSILFAFNITKVLQMFSQILFQFYTINEKRYLDQEEQKKLMTKIQLIEETLKIEQNKNLLMNNIQINLFFIKAAVSVTPTNSTEGQEILTQFIGGAIKSGLTFTLNDDLIASLKQGAIFLYNEFEKSKLKRKYQILYYINYIKFSVLEQIDNCDTTVTLEKIMQPLQQLYSTTIKQSKDWEIWCFWIQSIIDIISYKRIQKLKELKEQDLSEKSSIIQQINQDEFVYSVSWRSTQKDQIIQQILSYPQYQIVSVLQNSLINGYQLIEGFESIYLNKIQYDQNVNNRLFDKTFINKSVNFIAYITTLQSNFLMINSQQQNNEQKLKEQLTHIQDLINQLGLLELQLQQFNIWKLQVSKDLIIETQVRDLINMFTVNCQKYSQVLTQDNFNIIFGQPIQTLLNVLDETQKDASLDNLVSINNNLMQNPLVTSVTTEQNQCSINLTIIVMLCSCSFIRMNIRILYENLIEINKALSQSQNIDKLPVVGSKNNQDIYGYQLQKDCLQVLYKLITNNKIISEQEIQISRIKCQLQIVTICKLSLFIYSQEQLKQYIQVNANDIVLHKIVVSENLTNVQHLEKYLIQLQGGLKMILDLIHYEQDQDKKHQQGFSILESQNELKELKQFLEKINQSNQYETQEMFSKFYNFVSNFEIVVDQNRDKFVQVTDRFNQVQEKLKKLKNIEICIQTIGKIQVKNEKKLKIRNQIIEKLQTQIEEVLNLQLDLGEQDGLAQNFNDDIETFKKLNDETINQLNKILLIKEQLNQKLNDISKILDEQNDIDDLQKLQKLMDLNIISECQFDQQELLQGYLQNSSNFEVVLDLTNYSKIIQQYGNQKYPKELESQIHFILNQVDTQEQTQEQQNIYDKYLEQITELIENNQWRIRQMIIYSLIQLQDRCIKEESYKLISGLLVKLSILETDNRIKSLFQNQKVVQEMSKLTQQYWPSQQESVYKIIKQKISQLDALSMDITTESNPERKSTLTKQFNQQQEEINVQIKNIQSLSDIGITVLFLQDLKNNLLRIENKLKQLQDSINEIGVDIKVLKGRPFIDLLEVRMKKILQQAAIMNAENVYVPIKTKERILNEEGREDQETNLFTESLFGDGEINEFIWQQQKDSLLIHGMAGSGKSTAARKIEEFLWDLYQKNKLSTDLIPNIPIFISLPQLKDPIYSAVEETLRSDNYRLNERQIDELKEAVEQGKYRIIFIMDSYDELKQQFIGSNLNMSNKLQKWGNTLDTKKFPKIITTSRTELFIIKNYHVWFLSESNDITCFKEIRLVKFNESQVQEYIKQYYESCQKRILREYSDTHDIIEFEKIWKQEKKHLSIEKFVKKDQTNIVKQLFDQLWTPEKYEMSISLMQLESLLETPFMLEIVVVVLPAIVSEKRDINQIKTQFIQKYSDNEKESLEIWNYITSQNYKQFWSLYVNQQTQQQMLAVITDYFKNEGNFNDICKALILEPLTSYDFYMQFFEHYFDREIKKLREKGEQADIKSDLWEYTQGLALEMTFNNYSQVHYQQSSILFKKQQEDWKDEYFSNNGELGQIKRQLRKCIPLRQKNNLYSFNHKSLQEFLVAKWFIENTEKIYKQERFNNQNWQNDFLQGATRFIADKLRFNQNIQDQLFSIIKNGSIQNKQSIISASNSIHLLNQMNYLFQNKDLSSIILQDIDLSGINFYRTNLQNSQFRNVNISFCNFSKANLTQVKWEDIKLNETPKIAIDFDISQLQFLNEDTLLVFDNDKNIKQFNPQQYKEINSYKFDFTAKGLIRLNKKENQDVVAFYDNYSIYIFNIDDNTLIQQIQYGDCFSNYIQTMCFSNNDAVLYLGGDQLYSIDFSKFNLRIEAQFQYKSIKTKEIPIYNKNQFYNNQNIMKNQIQNLQNINSKKQPRTKEQILQKRQNKNPESEVDSYSDIEINQEKESEAVEPQKIQENENKNKTEILVQLQDDQISTIIEDNILLLKSHEILVAVHYSSWITVYDTKLNKKIKNFCSNQNKIQAVDTKNQTFVTGGEDKSIHVYQLANLEHYKSLNGHRAAVTELAIILDGEKVISSSSYDKTIFVWSLQSFTQLNQFTFNHRVTQLAAHNNLSIFCVYNSNNSLQLWDIDHTTTQTKDKIKGHQVQCCAFSFNNKYLASGSIDQKSIKLWDLFTGKQFGKDIGIQLVSALQFSVDSASIYSATSNGLIYQWEVATQKQLQFINNYNDKIVNIQAIDMDRILTLQSNCQVKLWNISQNQFKLIYDHEEEGEWTKNIDSIQNYHTAKNFKLHQDVLKYFNNNTNVTAIAQSQNKSLLALGTDQGWVKLINSNGRSSDIKCHAEMVRKILFLNEDTFLSIGSGKQVTIWKNTFKVQELSHDTNVCDVIIYKDLIIIGGFQIYCWNQKGYQLQWTTRMPNLEKATCLDCYEGTIYSGGEQGTVSAFDINKGDLVYSFQPHHAQITSIKYIIKTNQVLTVSKDTSIKLSFKTEIKQSQQEKQDQPILFLQISQDQTKFVIGNQEAISLYFVENLEYFESYHQFRNLQALFVDFENFDILTGNKDFMMKSYLSLKRIATAQQNQSNYNPTRMCYEDGIIYTGDSIGRIGFWDSNGTKQQQIWQTEVEENINQLKVDGHQILIGYLRQLRIYNLNDKSAIKIFPLNELEQKINSLHFYHAEQILYTSQSDIYLYNYKKDHTEMIKTDQIIRGSALKDNNLAIFGENELLRIYNVDDLCLQYICASAQEFVCDRTFIKNAKITSKSEMDLTIVLQQKQQTG